MYLWAQKKVPSLQIKEKVIKKTWKNAKKITDLNPILIWKQFLFNQNVCMALV